MNTRERQRFIVCAVGAVIGILVAYYTPSVLAWWMGALIGAATTGILFSYKEIRRCAPAAIRIAQTGLTVLPAVLGLPSRASQALSRRLRRNPWEVAAISVWIVTFSVFVAGLGISFAWGLWDEIHPIPLIALISEVHAGVGILIFLGAGGLTVLDWSKEEQQLLLAEKKRRMREATLLFFPGIGAVAITLMVVISLAKAVWPLLPKLPVLVRELLVFILRFLRVLYLLTHSRERVVVMADTGIAVLLSYFFLVRAGGWEIGPTLVVGAAIGGVLGFMHFKLASGWLTPRLQHQYQP